MIAPIVQQGWTLNYEMFFYALFGVAILFGPKRLFVILSALVAIPFIGLIVSPENVVSKFYTHNIVLEFGFGVVLQHYLTRFPEWKRSAYLTLMGIGFVLIAIGHNQEPRALAQGLPALLIVWCSFKACEGALKLPFVGLLGEASYAIYLFHWSSFGVMKPVTRLIGPDQVALLMLGHVAVGIGAGLAIHLLLEKRLTALASRLLLSEGTSRPQLAAPAVP
jgi:exopolysaccharide production protein ExoZ